MRDRHDLPQSKGWMEQEGQKKATQAGVGGPPPTINSMVCLEYIQLK